MIIILICRSVALNHRAMINHSDPLPTFHRTFKRNQIPFSPPVNRTISYLSYSNFTIRILQRIFFKSSAQPINQNSPIHTRKSKFTKFPNLNS